MGKLQSFPSNKKNNPRKPNNLAYFPRCHDQDKLERLRMSKLDKLYELLVLLKPGKSFWKGRLSTVDLFVLTSLDQLHLTLQTLFTFHKTSYLNEEVNHTGPSRSISIPS